MNAKEFLEEMTEPSESVGSGVGQLRGGLVVRAYAITGIGHEGLGNPSRVCQREMVVEGRKFLVQVISLSENY